MYAVLILYVMMSVLSGLPYFNLYITRSLVLEITFFLTALLFEISSKILYYFFLLLLFFAIALHTIGYWVLQEKLNTFLFITLILMVIRLLIDFRE